MRVHRLFLAVPLLVIGLACGGGGGGAQQQPDVPPDSVVQDDGGVTTDQGGGSQDTAKPDLGKIDFGGLSDSGTKDIPIPDPGPDIPGCPTLITGPTCAAKVACALQCPAEGSYVSQCVGPAADQETEKAQETLDCLLALNCQSLIENERFSLCAKEACKADLDACFAGNGICNDIRKCRMACEPNDYACPLRCLAEATLAEQEVWADYWTCIMGADCVQSGDVMANGWPTENCERYAQSHYCPNQTQACIPPQ